LYQVQSQTDPEVFYDVDLATPSCTCADFAYRGHECKHVEAVRAHVASMSNNVMTIIMTTKNQTEFFAKLTEGADRIAALAGKAMAIDCTILEKELHSIAKQLAFAVDLQRRAFSEDSQVRAAALAEAELLFRVL